MPVYQQHVSWQVLATVREKRTLPSIRVDRSDFCFEIRVLYFPGDRIKLPKKLRQRLRVEDILVCDVRRLKGH